MSGATSSAKQAGMINNLVSAVRSRLAGTPQLTPVNYDPFASDSPSVPQLSWAASQGQGGDSLLVHTTPGDVVIPQEAIDTKTRGALLQILGDKYDRFTVGSSSNIINAATGLRAFDASNDSGGGDGGTGGGTGDGGGGDNGGFGGGDMSGADNQGASDATGGYGQGDTGNTGGAGAADTSGFGLDMSGGMAQAAADAAAADATSNDGFADLNGVPSQISNPSGFALSPQEESVLNEALNNPASAKSLDINQSITGWSMIDNPINNFLNNPVSSMINTVLGIAIPGISEANLGLKAANMIDSDIPSSVGGVVVGAVNGLAAHGDDDQSAQQGMQDQGGGNQNGMQAFLTDAAPNPVAPGGAAPNMGRGSDILQQKQQQADASGGVTPYKAPNNPVHNINNFLAHNPFDASSFLGKSSWF